MKYNMKNFLASQNHNILCLCFHRATIFNFWGKSGKKFKKSLEIADLVMYNLVRCAIGVFLG